MSFSSDFLHLTVFVVSDGRSDGRLTYFVTHTSTLTLTFIAASVSVVGHCFITLIPSLFFVFPSFLHLSQVPPRSAPSLLLHSTFSTAELRWPRRSATRSSGRSRRQASWSTLPRRARTRRRRWPTVDGNSSTTCVWVVWFVLLVCLFGFSFRYLFFGCQHAVFCFVCIRCLALTAGCFMIVFYFVFLFCLRLQSLLLFFTYFDLFVDFCILHAQVPVQRPDKISAVCCRRLVAIELAPTTSKTVNSARRRAPADAANSPQSVCVHCSGE